MKRLVMVVPAIRRLFGQRDAALEEVWRLSKSLDQATIPANMSRDANYQLCAEICDLRAELTALKGKQKPEFSKSVYSHWGEVSVLQFVFEQEQISNGTYLDIGCYHPHLYSNTALLYQQG